MYDYTTLDPRATSVDHDPGVLFGVEVSVPALAEQCGLGNLDPQHTGADAQTAAIEAALACELPPPGATLATIRPDADSVGAMAVLELRARDAIDAEARGRIDQIAEADKEAGGPWPGPRDLNNGRDLLRPTSHVEALAADHKLPLRTRVVEVVEWLATGRFRREVEYTMWSRIVAVEAINATTARHVAHRVAAVESTHRLALSIGYCVAPIVVASNPQFQWQGGQPHLKHTIARWNTAIPMDWDGMLAALRDAEPGWGGSTSIVGSPQGQHSILTAADVIEVVILHA